jgi:hypothetical protein
MPVGEIKRPVTQTVSSSGPSQRFGDIAQVGDIRRTVRAVKRQLKFIYNRCHAVTKLLRIKMALAAD